MKTINQLSGVIFKWRGKLVEPIGCATKKVIFFREINAKPCPCCGEIKEYAEVEESPNFQNDAEAVNTLEE